MKSSNQDKKGGEQHFSRFDYYDSENGISWNLIQNKNKFHKRWIPSKFIFKCDNGNCCTYSQNLKNRLFLKLKIP
jgi:hypothetical protein